jgi:negative regulator of flagellin synthesis FlgM
MSPIDTSGIKPGMRVDTDRTDAGIRGGTTNEAGATAKAAPSDSVELTDTASRLTELQAEVSAMEGVDFGRVQEIREQIADGTYNVDANRVADALITMEKELL